MTPGAFLSRVLDPGLDWTATHGGVVQNRAAVRPWLLAVALQESALEYRAQVVVGDTTRAGPARSWFQIEQPTVGLLFANPVTKGRIRDLCAAAYVRPEPDDVWRAIEGHDLLAVGAARLLLLADPQPVPVTQDEGWATYLRVWGPGKPKPEKWPAYWRMAQSAIGGR